MCVGNVCANYEGKLHWHQLNPPYVWSQVESMQRQIDQLTENERKVLAYELCLAQQAKRPSVKCRLMEIFICWESYKEAA